MQTSNPDQNYKIRVTCTNCNWSHYYGVPIENKEMYVDGSVRKIECPKCNVICNYKIDAVSGFLKIKYWVLLIKAQIQAGGYNFFKDGIQPSRTRRDFLP